MSPKDNVAAWENDEKRVHDTATDQKSCMVTLIKYYIQVISDDRIMWSGAIYIVERNPNE